MDDETNDGCEANDEMSITKEKESSSNNKEDGPATGEGCMVEDSINFLLDDDDMLEDEVNYEGDDGDLVSRSF